MNDEVFGSRIIKSNFRCTIDDHFVNLKSIRIMYNSWQLYSVALKLPKLLLFTQTEFLRDLWEWES